MLDISLSPGFENRAVLSRVRIAGHRSMMKEKT